LLGRLNLLLLVDACLSHLLRLLDDQYLLLWIDLSLRYLLGLLDSLCLWLSVMEGNLDIASLALSMYSLLVQFYEPNFVCIRDLFLNWLHADDNLVDDRLYGIFYRVKVSRRSCKLDSIRHD
jgi:hypothetical protein